MLFQKLVFRECKYESLNNCVHLIFLVSPVTEIEYAPLQLVQIYFDTATYDEIERDVKVTLEAQLGLIGGIMGLLTGFSILSGVEIVYFVVKFFLSLRLSRPEVAQGKLSKQIGSQIY